MPSHQNSPKIADAGKPQENYLAARDKNLIPVYLLAKPLSYRQALALMRHDNEPELTEKCVVMAFVKKLPEPETVIQDISMQTIRAIINRFERLEREALKPDKMRSWSTRRSEDFIKKAVRRVFLKTIDDRRLFFEILRLVREFSEVRGEPYSKLGRRGRRLNYDPKIVVAILIYKAALDIGYHRLEAKLGELGIDARLPGRRRSRGRRIPSPSLLRKIIAREELGKWLDDFIEWLLRVKAREAAPFVEVKRYVLDGTRMKCGRLVKRVVAGEEKAAKETVDVKYLYNIDVDMYLGARLTSKRAVKELVERLRRGEILLADPEFFNTEVCEMAMARGVICVIKPRKTKPKSLALRLCSEAFDPSLYRLRKCGERGARVLGETVMRHKDRARRENEVRLIATQHNIKTLIRLRIRQKAILRLVTVLRA